MVEIKVIKLRSLVVSACESYTAKKWKRQ